MSIYASATNTTSFGSSFSYGLMVSSSYEPGGGLAVDSSGLLIIDPNFKFTSSTIGFSNALMLLASDSQDNTIETKLTNDYINDNTINAIKIIGLPLAISQIGYISGFFTTPISSSSKLIITNIQGTTFTPSTAGSSKILVSDQNSNVSWTYLTNSQIQDGSISESKITNLSSDLTNLQNTNTTNSSQISTNTSNISTLNSYFSQNSNITGLLNLSNILPGTSGQFLWTNTASTPTIAWTQLNFNQISPSSGGIAYQVLSTDASGNIGWNKLTVSTINTTGASPKQVIYLQSGSPNFWTFKQLDFGDILKFGSGVNNYATAGLLYSDGTNVGYLATVSGTLISAGTLPVSAINQSQLQAFVNATSISSLSPPTAAVNFNNNKLSNLANPTISTDAVNLKYLSIFLSGSSSNTASVTVPVDATHTVLTWDNTNTAFKWAQITSGNISAAGLNTNVIATSSYPTSNAYQYFLTGTGWVNSLGTQVANSVFYSNSSNAPSWAQASTSNPGLLFNDYQGNISFQNTGTSTTSSFPVLGNSNIAFVLLGSTIDSYVSGNSGSVQLWSRIQGATGRIFTNISGNRLYMQQGVASDHILFIHCGTTFSPQSATSNYARGGIGVGSSSPEVYSANGARTLEFYQGSSDGSTASLVTYFDSSGNKALTSDEDTKNTINFYVPTGDKSWLNKILGISPATFSFNNPHKCLNTRKRYGFTYQNLENNGLSEILANIHNGQSLCSDKTNCRVCSPYEFKFDCDNNIWKKTEKLKPKTIYQEEIIAILVGAVQDLNKEKESMQSLIVCHEASISSFESKISVQNGVIATLQFQMNTLVTGLKKINILPINFTLPTE